MTRTCDPDAIDPTLLPRPGALKLTNEEGLALDLERVARTLRQLEDRARGMGRSVRAGEIAGLVECALGIANGLAPDLVAAPR